MHVPRPDPLRKISPSLCYDVFMSVTLAFDHVGLVSVGDEVRGTLTVDTPKLMSHQGITVFLVGLITVKKDKLTKLKVIPKPVVFWETTIAVRPASSLTEGKHEIPFAFTLTSSNTLYETYVGQAICIEYLATAEIKRSGFSSTIRTPSEARLIVSVPGQGVVERSCDKNLPGTFVLNTASLKTLGKEVFDLEITGQLDRIHLDVTRPITGHIRIKRSARRISNIFINLQTVEEVTEGAAHERIVTPQPMIELAVGDVFRGTPHTVEAATGAKGGLGGDDAGGWSMPIHMLLQRVYVCATLEVKGCSVQFEAVLTILFEGNVSVTQTFPLQIFRPASGRRAGAGWDEDDDLK